MATDFPQQFEDLYQAADQALYSAKKAGKHGFVVKKSSSIADSLSESFHPVSAIPLPGLLEYINSGVALLEMGDPIRLIYVSQSFYRIIDADPQHFPLPQDLAQLIHPDDMPSLERALRQGLQQKQAVEHTHRLSANGKTWAWWHIRAVQVQYDNPHPVMLVTTTDVSQFKESELRLQEANRRLQTAFDQTDQHVWEVDLASAFFRLFSSGETIPRESAAIAFPEGLIAQGWIHPGSVPRFRDFANDLLQGQTQGSGNFVIQFQNTGCYGWACLSYRLLTSENGAAGKAIGIIEPLPQTFLDPKTPASLSPALPSSLTSDLVAILHADLTQDTVYQFFCEGHTVMPALSCSQLLQQESVKLFSEDERQTVAAHFSRDQLQTLHRQGVDWLSSPAYRRIDANGDIRWVCQTLHLTVSPDTQHLHLDFYQLRADQRCQWEAAIGGNTTRDPITHIYDRATMRLFVETLTHRQTEGLCSLALLHVGGLVKRYAPEPRRFNQLRLYLASLLYFILGESCLIGQDQPDQFLLFFPKVRWPRIVILSPCPMSGQRLISTAFSKRFPAC